MFVQRFIGTFSVSPPWRKALRAFFHPSGLHLISQPWDHKHMTLSWLFHKDSGVELLSLCLQRDHLTD